MNLERQHFSAKDIKRMVLQLTRLGAPNWQDFITHGTMSDTFEQGLRCIDTDAEYRQAIELESGVSWKRLRAYLLEPSVMREYADFLSASK